MEDKQEKAEKELFALYKKTKDPEIKKEITMQYLYIARTTATKLNVFIRIIHIDPFYDRHHTFIHCIFHLHGGRIKII